MFLLYLNGSVRMTSSDLSDMVFYARKIPNSVVVDSASGNIVFQHGWKMPEKFDDAELEESLIFA